MTDQKIVNYKLSRYADKASVSATKYNACYADYPCMYQKYHVRVVSADVIKKRCKSSS